MPTYDIPVVKDLPDSAAGKRRRIVVVTNPNAGSLEYMGPLQVFDEARLFLEHSGRADLAYDIEVVSTGTAAIYDRKGFSISANTPYHRVRGHVDTLLFQAADEHEACLRDEPFIACVAKMSHRVRRIVSVCTGAFILAEAGVLDGRRATTHWCTCEDFRRRYPRVTLDPDPIYVKDGHVYTSAGATSSMDLAVALVEEDFGTEFARRVAQGLVMFLRRPGNQAQFSVQVATARPDSEGVREIETYIASHLEGDLLVGTLAERFHMSPRNFTRVFRQKVGVALGDTSSSGAWNARVSISRRPTSSCRRSLRAVATQLLMGFGWPSTATWVSLRVPIASDSLRLARVDRDPSAAGGRASRAAPGGAEPA
jgi:transcriptional regulator GlxA family with amidase domain